MGTWTWAVSSCRGTSHVQDDTRCQDAFACSVQDRGARLIAVLCDGAGSALMGGEGAALIARTISVRARAHYAGSSLSPDDETVR
jgi:hypothetical protein